VVGGPFDQVEVGLLRCLATHIVLKEQQHSDGNSWHQRASNVAGRYLAEAASYGPGFMDLPRRSTQYRLSQRTRWGLGF
jgi:hypothetical protein